MASIVQVESAPISSNFETALDFSSRLLTPFQDSDTKSLTFGLVALVLSAIASWATGDEEKTSKNYPGLMEENDIMGRIPYKEIRNNVLQYKKNNSTESRMDTNNKKNKVTFQDYDATLKAFEDFMNWTKSKTKEGELLEYLMELGLSKAKGQENPADQFYENAINIVYDVNDKVWVTFDYYLG